MKQCEPYCKDPMDYVRIALALETLACHDKNYLSKIYSDDRRLNEEVQALLNQSLIQRPEVPTIAQRMKAEEKKAEVTIHECDADEPLMAFCSKTQL